jgi:hypothetical protein
MGQISETGLIVSPGGQTFLETGGLFFLLLKGPGPSTAQQVAEATAQFGPLAGTIQTVSGVATDVGGQSAILVP